MSKVIHKVKEPLTDLHTPAAAPESSLLPGELAVEISGVRYRLTTNLQDLAVAEDHHNREGRGLNLLHSFGVINLATTRTLWICALYKYHPQIGFDEALALLTPPVALMVGGEFAGIISASIEGTSDARV